MQIVIDALEETGAELMKIYEREYSIDEKEDKSPVTEADMMGDRMLRERLRETGDPVLTEEVMDIDIPEGTEAIWIVDPLDGTKDFIQKTGEFSLMVALLKDGKPVLGAVYAPAINKLWYAQEGQGAFLKTPEGTRQIRVSDINDAQDFRFVISRNHFRDEDKAIADRLGISNYKKMGSVGVKFCSIAGGEAELCAYTTPKMGIWDDCASHVILKEAGGSVFDVEGNEPSYNLDSKKMEKGFIGTNGKDTKKVMEAIREG